MNNEDMSDIIQKLSSMMNNSNNADSINDDTNSNNDMSSGSDETSFNNLQNILSNLNFNNQNNENSNQENTDNNFNLDFETIIKMKNVMDKLNSKQNGPESNLLLSLKPYLNNNRKQKLDQYMQFLKISKVIESLNLNGGVNNK